MILPQDIASWLHLIHDRATAGYAVALHLRLHAPRYLFQTFPRAWSAAYADERLIFLDPTAAWGMVHTGRAAWADLAVDDHAGVLARAAEHGLQFGLAVSVLRGGSRSMASLARRDRAFFLRGGGSDRGGRGRASRCHAGRRGARSWPGGGPAAPVGSLFAALIAPSDPGLARRARRANVAKGHTDPARLSRRTLP